MEVIGDPVTGVEGMGEEEGAGNGFSEGGDDAIGDSESG